MVYSPTCQEPIAYGLLDLKIAVPAFEGTEMQDLIDLGSTVDSTDVQNRPFFHDIHTDRNGGHQGPPNEVQYLGHIVNINLELATWNPVAIEHLRKRAVNATQGKVLQSEIGEMMLKEKSIRLLMDTPDPADTRNFWCCLVREPMNIGMGTKWSSYRLSFTAYRPPCYHQKADIIEDTNNGVQNDP